MKTSTTAVMVFGAVILVAGPARAAESPPGFQRPSLVLELAGCDHIPSTEVGAVVATELRQSVVMVAAGIVEDQGAQTVTVAVRCVGTNVSIDIYDPLTTKSLKRTVSLAETAPIAHPHLIGLAVAELVLASWSELQTNPRPIGTVTATGDFVPAKVAALETVRHKVTSPRDRLRLTALVSALAFSDTPVLWGGGLRFQHRHGDRWGWMADVAIHRGLRSTALGDVSVDANSVAASTYAEVVHPFGFWQAAMGVQVGEASLRGTPGERSAAESGQVQGPWGGPHLQIGTVIAPTKHLVLALALECGWTVFSLTADVEGQAPIAIRGGWARLSAGMGFTL